jgi:hypothetical protein
MTEQNVRDGLKSFQALLDAIPKGKYARVVQHAINVEVVLRNADAAVALLTEMEGEAEPVVLCGEDYSARVKDAVKPLE